MFREETALEALESVDSRRFLAPALAATALVIVVPALVVVTLSPLSGVADVFVSALLATGLSVAAASAASGLWTRLPQSREMPFADLMLWAWARRVLAERRPARAGGGSPHAAIDCDLSTLRTLVVVYEARDPFGHGHSGRVARHTRRIARRLGLPDEEVARIEAAAAVHDVGMLGVPSAVSRDEGVFPDERAAFERHASDGAERVAAVAGAEIAALVRHHHERVDGSGYPDGLAGDDIPLGSRIIAVADRFDELTSPARQRAASSRRDALDDLAARAGTELDPGVVAAFARYYSGTRSIAGVALAATAPQRAVRWISAAPAAIGSAAGAPVVLQGICAAGTAAIASACLAGLPGSGSERSDGPAAHQRSERLPARGAEGPRLTTTPDPVTRAKGDDRDRGGRTLARDEAAAPRSRQAPFGGRPAVRDVRDVGATIPPPPTGGAVDRGGGGGPSDEGGGIGNGGKPLPATPAPPQPVAPVQPPQEVSPPPVPVDPGTALDPVLEGLSDAVPEAKRVTDGVEGLVGGEP